MRDSGKKDGQFVLKRTENVSKRSPYFYSAGKFSKMYLSAGNKNQKTNWRDKHMQKTEEIKKMIIMKVEHMNEKDHKFLMRLHIIITTHLKKTGK